MRSKQRLLLLLLTALFSVCIHHLSATSLGRVEKIKENDEQVKRATAHVSKFSRGRVGGGGNPVVPGGNGGSHSPSGGGVTPLYAAAAGAGSNHHPHRGGGNSDRGGAGLGTLAITTSAWFLLCLLTKIF